jgi:hypothetical protein
MVAIFGLPWASRPAAHDPVHADGKPPVRGAVEVNHGDLPSEGQDRLVAERSCRSGPAAESRLHFQKLPPFNHRVMSLMGHKRTSSHLRSKCRRGKTDELGGTWLEAFGISELAPLGRN